MIIPAEVNLLTGLTTNIYHDYYYCMLLSLCSRVWQGLFIHLQVMG